MRTLRIMLTLAAVLAVATTMPAKGLPDANRSLRLNPKNASALDTRGHIFRVLGRRAEAIRDFRAALKLKPGMKSARDGLGKLGVKP